MSERKRYSWQWWELITRVQEPGVVTLRVRRTQSNKARSEPSTPYKTAESARSGVRSKRRILSYVKYSQLARDYQTCSLPKDPDVRNNFCAQAGRCGEVMVRVPDGSVQ